MGTAAHDDQFSSIVGKQLSVVGLQFAADGRWEETLVLRRGSNAWTALADDWLARHSGDLAVEVLLGDDLDRPTGFFGIRLRDEQRPEARSAFARVVQTFAPVQSGRPLDLLRHALLTCEPGADLIGEPDVFEMGVFNLWQSAQSLRLEPNPRADLRRLREEGRVPRWVHEGHVAPIFLEAAWTQPLECWLAIPVGEDSTGRFCIDDDQVPTGW